jgi:hypothetical protein
MPIFLPRAIFRLQVSLIGSAITVREIGQHVVELFRLAILVAMTSHPAIHAETERQGPINGFEEVMVPLQQR